MTARMILIGVKFEGADVNIPGLGNVDQLPDKTSGWTGKLEGYSMRVVGERLEVWAPAGIQQSTIAQAELTANGIEHGEALSMVSIPLHRCTLRYVGTVEALAEIYTEPRDHAPSMALRKPKPPAPKPVNENVPDVMTRTITATAEGIAVTPFVAAKPQPPKKAPQPTPRGPVAPTPRKPPNARGPSKETGVVRDLSAEEAEAVVSGRSSVGLAVDHVAGAAELEE